LKSCVDGCREVLDLSAAKVLAGHVLVAAEVNVAAKIRHDVH
jgi:hypothetical protein